MMIGRNVFPPRDALCCAVAVLSCLVTLSVAMVNNSKLNDIQSLGSPQVDGAPIHAALPDLCKAFPMQEIEKLVPEAEISGHALDRNVAECEWESPLQHRQWASLGLEVKRAVLKPGEANEQERAAWVFTEELRLAERDGRPTRITGLGDDAALIRRDAGSQLVIRSGLLVATLDYAMLAGGSGEGQVVLRQVAAKLLRILPQKGN